MHYPTKPQSFVYRKTHGVNRRRQGKLLFTIVVLLISTNLTAQTSGTITIEKNDSTKADAPAKPERTAPIRLQGLFYSDWVADEVRVGNNVTFKETRYYFYCTKYGEVYFFRSVGNPKKLAKAFQKNPNKYAEEIGKYELTDGELYIQTGDLSSNKIYRYTGEANSSKIWLGMKAEYQKKVQLDLYLTKYLE